MAPSSDDSGAQKPADGTAYGLVPVMRWLDRAVRGLALLAGVILLALGAFTVFAAMMRYIFNNPITGAGDLQQMTLIVVIFLALSYCGRTGGHVAVDLFTQMLGPRVTRVSDVIVNLLAAAVFVVLAIWSIKVGNLFTMQTQSIEIPHRPFYYVIAGGSGLHALILVLETAALLLGRTDLAERKEG